MSPNLTKANLTDERFGDSKLFGNFVVASTYFRSVFSYLSDCFVIKFGLWLISAFFNKFRSFVAPVFFAGCRPSFRSSICGVISASSEKKMPRIYTWRIIARMADTHPRRYISKVNLVRIAMSGNGLFLWAKSTMPTSCLYRSVKLPALSEMWHVFRNRTILIDLLPKPLALTFESLKMSIHKQNHPARQKCCRRIVSRSCQTGWEKFVSSMLLGYNRAIEMMASIPATVK